MYRRRGASILFRLLKLTGIALSDIHPDFLGLAPLNEARHRLQPVLGVLRPESAHRRHVAKLRRRKTTFSVAVKSRIRKKPGKNAARVKRPFHKRDKGFLNAGFFKLFLGHFLILKSDNLAHCSISIALQIAFMVYGGDRTRPETPNRGRSSQGNGQDARAFA